MMMKCLSLPEVQSLLDRSHIPFQIAPTQHRLIVNYFERRYVWNKRHSIVGPQALADPWVIDFLDAAALMGLLDKEIPLYDVGTGSGVPGMLVALLNPGCTVRLIEPLAKRCAFLKQFSHQFKLTNVSVERTRWPIENTEIKQVVSRAVVSPKAWPMLASDAVGVKIIYRYLAQQRPDIKIPNFTLGSTVEYSRNGRGDFLIESWEKIDEAD